MSPQSLIEYTEVIAKRYKRACYNTKKEILDEYCQVTGLHRKHCIRKLNNFKFFQKPKKNKRGRKSIYNQPRTITHAQRIIKSIRAKSRYRNKDSKSYAPRVPHG